MRTSKSISCDFSISVHLFMLPPNGISQWNFQAEEKRRKKIIINTFVTIDTHFNAKFDLTNIIRAQIHTHTHTLTQRQPRHQSHENTISMINSQFTCGIVLFCCISLLSLMRVPSAVIFMRSQSTCTQRPHHFFSSHVRLD